MTKSRTALSTKRIILSTFILIFTAIIGFALTKYLNNHTIAYTFALNLGAALYIFYDWNLFGIHYNRAKGNPLISSIYTFIGILFIGILFILNPIFLDGYILQIIPEEVQSYMFGIPAMILAFSYMLSLMINISMKCLTDRFVVHNREALIILISGFLYSFIYSFLFTPFQMDLFIRSYIHNIILMTLLSYLYNQSGSIIPGIISLGTVLFILQLTIFLGF